MAEWTRSDVIALSDERELWLGRVLDAERCGFERGYAAAMRDGFGIPCCPLDVDPPGDWPVRALGPIPQGPDPRMDKIRWPPSGRKRFGRPRPRDWPGLEHGGAFPVW